MREGEREREGERGESGQKTCVNFLRKSFLVAAHLMAVHFPLPYFLFVRVIYSIDKDPNFIGLFLSENQTVK